MSSRVIVPFTNIHPAAEAALNEHAPGHERFYVGHNDEAYWRLLADLWAVGESFVLVEHDVEITAATLPSFDACGEPWCAFPYPSASWAAPTHVDALIYESLGCTRFDAALMEATPGLVEEMGRLTDGLPPRDWRRCDTLLAGQLHQAGFERAHTHWPAVRHHHGYQDGSSAGWLGHTDGRGDGPR